MGYRENRSSVSTLAQCYSGQRSEYFLLNGKMFQGRRWCQANWCKYWLGALGLDFKTDMGDTTWYGRVFLLRMKFRAQRGGDVENLVELYCVGDCRGSAWPPKAKNYAPLGNCAKRGPKGAPGAYFAVIGRRKSDLLILKDAAEIDGPSGENSVHEVAIAVHILDFPSFSACYCDFWRF
jgi:hypothetical protein